MKLTIFLFITGIGICQVNYAQNVAINSTGVAPNSSAILDLSASNKGLLLPRMTSSQRNGIANPAKGLLVYDSTTAGFWFYNGVIWTGLPDRTNVWNLTGNNGSSALSNFIGTTDTQPLRFRINNINSGLIDSTLTNTGMGFRTLDSNFTGFSNTAFGYKTLTGNVNGNSNTGTGFSALRYNKGGSGNTAHGGLALCFNSNGQVNTAIGYAALYSNTMGSFNTAGGYSALLNNTVGNYNTANGQEALLTNSTGNNNTASGAKSLYLNTSGEFNTANGANALSSNTTGFKNTGMGESVMYANTTGFQNTAVGTEALFNNSTGTFNIAFGEFALARNVGGNANTAIGSDALSYLVNGNKNIAIGASAGSAPGSPNVNNTISIGNDDILNGANNQVIIGNFSSTGYYAHNSWSTFSDARIKMNTKNEVIGLDFIMRLKPVTYYKSIKAMVRLTDNKETPDFPGKNDVEKIKYSGFLAQDVQQAAKETGYDFSGLHVPNNSKELYALSYETFVVPLVKAMQEQQKIIEAQSTSISSQQIQINNMSLQIAEMKKAIKKLSE